MKKDLTMKLAAGFALASTFAISSMAQANIIYSVSGPGATVTEENAFLDSLVAGSGITEGFEDTDANGNAYNGGDQATSFNTNVGTFSSGGTSSGDACSFGTFVCEGGSDNLEGGLGIVDEDIMKASPGGSNTFYGRFPLPETEGNDQYLDSLDHEQVLFTLNEGFNALGFFLTDPNDAGGILDINAADGAGYTLNIEDILGGSQNNKGAFYLSFFSFGADITSITLTKNNSSDGVGFDNVTVGRVPEPGTLALLGLGLAGLGIARRRKSA